MTFNDIFFLFITPVLAAVVVGYAVNLYARMRERTRARAYQHRIEMLDRALEELRSEAERMRSESDARARLLQRWQAEILEPLAALRAELGLGTLITLDTKPEGIPAANAESFGILQEKVSLFRSAGVPVLSEIAQNLAMLHFAARQWREAIELLEETIEGDPTNRDARQSLGNLLLRRRNFEEAQGQFRALLELSSKHFEAHLGLGLSLVELGRLKEAIEVLGAAISLRPDHARSYCELGRAFVADGQLERALESAQVALKLDPGMTEGRLLLQQILIKSGNFEEAIKACRDALADGESARVFYNLATAHTMGGDYESAIDALRRSFALDDEIRFAAKDDPAFHPLRESRRFRDLMEGRPGLF